MRKTGDFRGFFRQKRGQKGAFEGLKAGKKPLICVPVGWARAQRGFWGLNQTLCPRRPAPENHPGGNAPRATDEKLLRHGGEPVTAREGRAVITWSGSGEAGKKLLYTVRYSSDGGKNWEERVFEKTATSAEIELSRESSKHAVKVIATDGSRSAEAVVHCTAP